VSYKYIKSGSIGRSIPGKNVQNELIIILDGSLRLIFGHGSGSGGGGGPGLSGADKSFGDIKCTQSGEKSAVFKVGSYILLLVMRNVYFSIFIILTHFSFP
jgi:hypothetical protein